MLRCNFPERRRARQLEAIARTHPSEAEKRDSNGLPRAVNQQRALIEPNRPGRA